VSLSFTSLGTSTLTGNAGVEQAIAVKKQLRTQLPFVEGAFPMLVPDPETRLCEVRVAYDRSFPRAESWTDRAAELAPSIWEKVQRQSRERVPG